MNTPKKGAERKRDWVRIRVLSEKEKGWLKLGEKERVGEGARSDQDRCVCVLVLRRTRADGEHVPSGHERRQRPAVGHREKGSRDSLLFFFVIWELCVSDVGGLVF